METGTNVGGLVANGTRVVALVCLEVAGWLLSVLAGQRNHEWTSACSRRCRDDNGPV